MIIKLITKKEKYDVYDIINVEDNNNYIANNFVVHNSSADWARCLDGDSLISTPNGGIKIKDLEGQSNIEVLSYDEKTNKFEYQIAEKCVKTKTDIVFHVTTTHTQIKATKDHRFYTDEGWKHLYQMQVGDDILSLKNKFEKIISITKGKKVPVFDILNVNKNNNYIANKLVVHNSENKELRKKLAQVRTKHLLFILCFPLKIQKMEKNYLESFVNYWCVTKNTNINIINKKTKKESIKKLKYINPATDNILSFKQTCSRSGGYEYKKFKDVILTKKKSTIYELKLESGDKLKATLDHPFLTLNGWKRMEDVSLIDSIRCLNVGNGLSFSQVVSIKKLSQREDVYDIIGVEDNHNFVANNMVVHNCDLFGRGIGAIYVKDRNPSADPWRMKDFKNVGAYTEFTSLSQVEKKLKKHPNFWQIIKFPKPPAWLYSKYLEVREKNVYNNETVRDMVTTEDIHKALLVLALEDVMMNDTTFNINRIILHIKNKYDIPITKKHIQALLSDSKQLVNKIREESIS